MKKEYPLRHKDEYRKQEYRKPNTCECTHGKHEHADGGFWLRRECEICKCPKYVRDKELEGYYVECASGEGDGWKYHSMARGTFYLKKVSNT